MSSDPKTPISRQTPFWPLVILAMAVVTLWAASGLMLYGVENRGTFGDMFGAINALFSGLAFSGVIYTIFLQRKELELQREELRYTRQELARSAAAQEKSEEALRQQVAAAEYGQRIAALNHMLEFSLACNSRIQKEPLGTNEKSGVGIWAERRFELMEELNNVYGQLFPKKG